MKKMRSKLLLIALAAILVTLLSQQTLAYYSVIGKATNVVTSGDIQLIIHEQTGDGSEFPEEGVYIMPGDVVSKRVSIENDCTHPFYLRVKLIKGIENSELPVEDVLQVEINTESWTLREDGYIYYNRIVQPGQTTAPVFTHVQIVGSQVDTSYIGHTLTLTVNAFAVQSENNPAEFPWDASGWPAEEGGAV